MLNKLVDNLINKRVNDHSAHSDIATSQHLSCCARMELLVIISVTIGEREHGQNNQKDSHNHSLSIMIS